MNARYVVIHGGCCVDNSTDPCILTWSDDLVHAQQVRENWEDGYEHIHVLDTLDGSCATWR